MGSSPYLKPLAIRTVHTDVTCAMKKLSESERVVRINASLPPAAARWVHKFAREVADKAGFGTKPSISGVVEQAIMDLMNKVQGKKDDAEKKYDDFKSELEDESRTHKGNPVNKIKGAKRGK